MMVLWQHHLWKQNDMFGEHVFLGSSFLRPKYSAALMVKLKKQEAWKKKEAKLKAQARAKVHWNEDASPQSKVQFGKWIDGMVEELEKGQGNWKGKHKLQGDMQEKCSTTGAAKVTGWLSQTWKRMENMLACIQRKAEKKHKTAKDKIAELKFDLRVESACSPADQAGEQFSVGKWWQLKKIRARFTCC